ncbi:hypothetical protein RJ639_038041 [Escallonia herrerae]|uniref:DUF4283 domain-containing protein n=1 Tax=Escallonia herrerae TaxID=1293975 RepID=A0AA89B8E6_9ASTE|nr:hypothetical protein RJ639_038041 [Escallonia herrerae]
MDSSVPSCAAMGHSCSIHWKTAEGVQVSDPDGSSFLFEFPSPEEATRILEEKKWFVHATALLLDRWNPPVGCYRGDFKPKSLWIRNMGLPLHLWGKEVWQNIGDKCGGYIRADESTVSRTNLRWARLEVLAGGTIPASTSFRAGGIRFVTPIWRESAAWCNAWKPVSRKTYAFPKFSSSKSTKFHHHQSSVISLGSTSSLERDSYLHQSDLSGKSLWVDSDFFCNWVQDLSLSPTFTGFHHSRQSSGLVELGKGVVGGDLLGSGGVDTGSVVSSYFDGGSAGGFTFWDSSEAMSEGSAERMGSIDFSGKGLELVDPEMVVPLNSVRLDEGEHSGEEGWSGDAYIMECVGFEQLEETKGGEELFEEMETVYCLYPRVKDGSCV